MLTLTGRKCLQYTGSVRFGTKATYGKAFGARVSGSEYSRLISLFSGSTVEMGTSWKIAPAGSLGKWLQSNVAKPAIACYGGPILINEEYAEKVGESKIRIK